MKRLFLLTLISLSLTANATDYYISSSGNDASNGTSPSSPWKTITKVNSQKFLPGDFILFRRGDMWREQLTIPSSGEEGNPITFSSYGTGAKPIINGADVVTGWTDNGSNVWWINNPNPTTTRAMVILNGVIQSEVSSLAAVNSAGKYFIHIAGTPDRIYVYSQGTPQNAEVSARDHCILAQSFALRHHINIVGIECRYSGGGGITLYANGSDFDGRCVVDSCTFYANRLWGCATRDKHNNDIFKNSTATYNGNGFYAWDGSKNAIMQRCSTMHNISYLIKPNFTDGHGFGNYKGDGWLVENCYSDNDFDGIHIDCGGVAADAIIRYNKVFRSRNHSPKSPGYAVGTLGAGATIQIYYNLAVDCAASSLEAFTNMSGNVLVYNNTFYHGGTSGDNAIVYTTKTGTGWVLKNNLFIRTYTGKSLISVAKPPAATCDYNNYYISNNTSETLRNHYNGTTYTSLAAWQAATGQDAHSISIDPAVNSDYSLKVVSPCIDKGVDVGLTKDILGNPIVGLPDIGAFEYGSGGTFSNINPTANAGEDQTIALPTDSVNLTGSGADPDGTIASYEWSCQSGPATYAIGNANAAVTTLNNLVKGIYVLRLTVTDDKGVNGFDDVQVTVNSPPTINVAPVANAGADQTTTLDGNPIILNGSATDSDGKIDSYEWTKLSGPSGEVIDSPAAASTSVTGITQGGYTFRLAVTDDKGATAYDDVQVTVNVPPPPLPPPNQSPVSKAGADQAITLPSNSVTLNGTGIDPDGTITSYKWSKVSGPSGESIAAIGAASTNITGLVEGVYTFRLTVTDNKGATGTDDAEVTVNPIPNKVPIANAGNDISITLPVNYAQLDGRNSSDPDGVIKSWSWKQTKGVSNATISNTNTVTPMVSSMTQGQYEFELSITDDRGAVSKDLVFINVVKINKRPVARVQDTMTVILPVQSAELDGTASYDLDGNIRSYSWKFINGTVAPRILSPDKPKSVVTDLMFGDYEFELTVTDDDGEESKAVVHLIVKYSANSRTELTVGVYPNPASSQVNFRLEAEAVGRSTITIYSANGSAMLTEVFVKTSRSFLRTVEISNLAKGTYSAVIKIDVQESAVRKLVKL